jgi:hypothetical protein
MGIRPYPETENSCTVYASSKNPAVFCPSSSSTNLNGDMTFVIGKNGNAEITISVDSTKTTGYVRKVYRVFVDLEDNLQNTEILYDNPTITLEGVKAKAVQGDKVQYFDLSWTPNTGYPGYVDSVVLYNDEGVPHYLSLVRKGLSPFGKNGLHLDSGGWYTEGAGGGSGLYKMQPSALILQGITDGVFRLKELNNSLDPDYLAYGIEIFNQAFPAISIVQDSTSKNTIEGSTLDDDGIFGVTWTKSVNGEYVTTININVPLIQESFGDYSRDNKPWVSFLVHEMGHILGPADEASHKPSLYDYGRDRSVCYYLQANDIAWIENIYKVMHGIDLTTNQEDFINQISNLEINLPEEDIDIINFEYVPITEDSADVVLNCKLSYLETIISPIGAQIEYDIFKIIDENVVSGQLESFKFKVPSAFGLTNKINDSMEYKLLLIKNKDGIYSTNPYEGIIGLN